MMIRQFVRENRKRRGMTQPELAERAGVGLRFIRELEQGKTTLRIDKVNQVLRLFGHELVPGPMDRASFSDDVQEQNKTRDGGTH
jgi:y4mF family transcriptional regulator